MTAYMSRSLNLAGYSSATLTFWYKIPSIETGYDLCGVYMVGPPTSVGGLQGLSIDTTFNITVAPKKK